MKEKSLQIGRMSKSPTKKGGARVRRFRNVYGRDAFSTKEEQKLNAATNEYMRKMMIGLFRSKWSRKVTSFHQVFREDIESK